MQFGVWRGWRGAAIGVGTRATLTAVAIFLVGIGAAQGQTPHKYGVMPKVLPREFAQQGSDMAQKWRADAMPLTKNRVELYRKFSAGLADFAAFRKKITEIYPEDQLEWLLITDEVADSLVRNWTPVLDQYQKDNPEEVLTKGRQLYELTMMQITGPPSRMLGFHALLLAEYAEAKADSLF
ncbi:MAG: hypothetical protein R3E12_20660, partial [Candidatus Eisenbacteria bacterium]